MKRAFKARAFAFLVVLSLIIPLLGAPANAADSYKAATVTKSVTGFIPGQPTKAWKAYKGDKVFAQKKTVTIQKITVKKGRTYTSTIKCFTCYYPINNQRWYVYIPVSALKF